MDTKTRRRIVAAWALVVGLCVDVKQAARTTAASLGGRRGFAADTSGAIQAVLGELLAGIVMGVISIVIISQILADTGVAAAMDDLTKLIVGFLCPAISIGLVGHALQTMLNPTRAGPRR